MSTIQNHTTVDNTLLSKKYMADCSLYLLWKMFIYHDGRMKCVSGGRDLKSIFASLVNTDTFQCNTISRGGRLKERGKKAASLKIDPFLPVVVIDALNQLICCFVSFLYKSSTDIHYIGRRVDTRALVQNRTELKRRNSI